jgi:hypothetical protein
VVTTGKNKRDDNGTESQNYPYSTHLISPRFFDGARETVARNDGAIEIE